MATTRPAKFVLRGVTALALVASAAAFAASGHAQTRLETPDPRYRMQETDDGYLRLDSETGAVSHCRKVGADWSCNITPDERRALEAEVRALREERHTLQSENQRLRSFLRDLALRADRAAVRPDDLPLDGDPPRSDGRPARTPSATDPDGDGDFAEEAKRDIDQAMDVTEYAVRRLFGTFRDLEQDFPFDR